MPTEARSGRSIPCVQVPVVITGPRVNEDGSSTCPIEGGHLLHLSGSVTEEHRILLLFSKTKANKFFLKTQNKTKTL